MKIQVFHVFVSSLTQTLDQLSVNLSSSLNTTQSQVVQPNLVVQSAQVPAADTQGVQFTSLTGQRQDPLSMSLCPVQLWCYFTSWIKHVLAESFILL